MKKKTNKIDKFIKKAVSASLTSSANSTTCMMYHQPKAPQSLKKFSKISNDK